jgi:L-rhamnonate dehydratase
MASTELRITDVEALILESPGTYGTDGAEVHGFKHSCVFIVSTDQGLTGFAQIETQPHVARAILEAPGDDSGLMSGLRALAVGEDALEIEALWERLFIGSYLFGRRGAALQAISGIDIACWDLLGKFTGLPVSTLLGGRRRDSAVAYASTLFPDSVEAVGEACDRYVSRGFRAVKFGWGAFGEDARKDRALAEAAREGLGPDRDLMIDAGWRRRRTAKEAIRMIEALVDLDPRWVEEPCFPEDYATYRRVCDAVSVDIAAGEAETTIWGLSHLVDTGRIDVLQPDLSRCGGLTVARRAAYMADRLNVHLCPHAWGTDILTAATLQFVAFLPKETYVEFNAAEDVLSRGLVEQPFELRDGMLDVPDLPGLGVTPDEDALRALAVA